MRIHCLTTFLDGTDRFEKDDHRTVDDERGARFVANGWAVAEGGEAVAPASGDTSLDIQNVTQGQEAAHG